jgi:hypothetical protein
MANSREITLVDVVQAVREVAASEQETLVTVVHLITSGQVRLSDDARRVMSAFLATTDTAA